MHALADLKRRLGPGVTLRCLRNTLRPALQGSLWKVLTTQRQGFWCTVDFFPHVRRVWMAYPQAHAFRWLDAETFQIDVGTTRSVILVSDAGTTQETMPLSGAPPYVQFRFI
jgi:hypothetical protein